MLEKHLNSYSAAIFLVNSSQSTLPIYVYDKITAIFTYLTYILRWLLLDNFRKACLTIKPIHYTLIF